MSELGFRCADAARARDDDLSATAPPATRWLLIEYPGAWAANALRGSTIELAIQDRLVDVTERRGVRILFVRRPLRRGSETPTRRRWMVITRGAPSVEGSWVVDTDLIAAVDAVQAAPPPAPDAASDTEPDLILVCTHGVHDLCCALRGRPVALDLARRWPTQTWECSHVGGDRFAANVVLLPDGVYYGNLDPASARAVVDDHLSGVVNGRHLRGVSGHPAAAQAVMTRLHARQPIPPGGIEVLSVSGDRVQGWTVEVRVGERTHRARVIAEAGPTTTLTCRAPRAGSATRHRVIELETIETS